MADGEVSSGGRDNPALIANCCEAVIAALFLDGGLEAADAFIRRQWRPLMEEEPLPPKDAKTSLQEWAQAHGLPLPEYRIVSQRGPGHAPMFLVEVSMQGQPPTEAEGPNRRAAEQAAAELMFGRLGDGK
jgi:ribonuclease-3